VNGVPYIGRESFLVLARLYEPGSRIHKLIGQQTRYLSL